MYKGLYDNFKHWYRGGNIWLYSDPHFGDKDALKFRKYSEQASDEAQVKSINSKVGRNDTIIFLGDIGNIDLIERIRGYKVLIMGNHDVGATKYKKSLDNKLFDEVYEGPVFINNKMVLSHEPINLPFVFNLHGHKHDLPHRYDDSHLNFCAEAINFTPVSLITLLKEGAAKNVKDIHRFGIDKRK